MWFDFGFIFLLIFSFVFFLTTVFSGFFFLKSGLLMCKSFEGRKKKHNEIDWYLKNQLQTPLFEG